MQTQTYKQLKQEWSNLAHSGDKVSLFCYLALIKKEDELFNCFPPITNKVKLENNGGKFHGVALIYTELLNVYQQFLYGNIVNGNLLKLLSIMLNDVEFDRNEFLNYIDHLSEKFENLGLNNR